MANFFNNVIAPQLNSTEYGQGIQDMVNTINDNFQKVFTLPFLQGDDGDMISTEFCPFWEKVYNSNDEIEVDNCLLTQEGAKIYNTIFETTLFEENMVYEDFKKVLIDDLKLYSIGNSYNDISLFTNLYGPHKDPKILLFYKISSEDGVSETPLGSSQLYYYFDPRINELSELITINNNDNNAKNYRQDFRDYTCILSTKYDSDGNYTYEKQSGWPTLYFDNSSKQYCWSINGQKTGINAQGVNGKDGIGARIWVCQVELDEKNSSQVNYETGTMSRFIIKSVFVPKDSGWREPGDTLKSYLGETNYFQQGDMAVCYLPNTENKYSDQMIGVIKQNSNDNTFFVQASISQNTTNTFKNLSLFNLLSSIGTGENDTPTMKGIFIPTTVGDNTPAHTLFEGKFNDVETSGLYLVKTDNYNNIKFDGSSIELLNNGDTFNVYYNTNIYGETVLEGALNTYNVIFNTTTGTDNNGKDWYVGGYLDFYGNKNTTGGKTSYKRSLRLFEKEGELFAINNGGVNPSSDGYGSATINTGVLKSRQVVVGSSDSLNSSGLNVTGTTILNSGAEIYNGLTVNGATTLNGTLTVDGITSLTGGLTANNITSPKADLNNYKTAGFYRCSATAVAGTLSNSPTKNAFALNIYETTGNGGGTYKGVVQEIIEYNVNVNTDGTVADATANTFKRHLYSDTWGSWYRIPKSMSLTDNVGGPTQPIYMDSNGIIKACDLYAGGTKVSLNGTPRNSLDVSFFAPTSTGKSEQVLVSNGSGAPTWKYTFDNKYQRIVDITSKVSTGTQPAGKWYWWWYNDEGKADSDNGQNIAYEIDCSKTYNGKPINECMNLNFILDDTVSSRQIKQLWINIKNLKKGYTYLFNLNVSYTNNISYGFINNAQFTIAFDGNPHETVSISNGKNFSYKLDRHFYVVWDDGGKTEVDQWY